MATAAAPAVLEDLRILRGPRSGLTMPGAIARRVAARALGGLRIWTYASEGDAVRDAEPLAGAMTLKAACAGRPLGGGKGVIAIPPGETLAGARRHAALEDFAEL